MAAEAAGLGTYDSKSEVARPRHLKPVTIRCVNRSHDDAVAVRTPKNCAHGRRVQMQRPHGSGKATRLTLGLRRCHIENEEFLKEARGRIAI